MHAPDIEPSPIVYWHRGKLCFTWRWILTAWNNEYFNNEPWISLDEWFVFIGWNPSDGWFGPQSLKYDGNWVNWFSLFGFIIGGGYSFASQAAKTKAHHE